MLRLESPQRAYGMPERPTSGRWRRTLQNGVSRPIVQLRRQSGVRQLRISEVCPAPETEGQPQVAVVWHLGDVSATECWQCSHSHRARALQRLHLSATTLQLGIPRSRLCHDGVKTSGLDLLSSWQAPSWTARRESEARRTHW